INVNSVAPGFIKTPMIDQTAARMGVSTEDFAAGAAAALPLRRFGVPDDIAGVISFLVGPDSSYITGQNIYVDGGYR
ncbi:MAG: SDR family oxidoreductase, partial [Actinophytocola sp.]|nr:SDR family oxidoreductase [Actinophytocola sp.]